MASPAKRRKKNDHQSSPSAVRSLDYFFARKKRSAAGEEKLDQNVSVAEPLDTRLLEGVPRKMELTDEELARKLEKEWNHEFQPNLPTLAIGEDGLQQHDSGAEDPTAVKIPGLENSVKGAQSGPAHTWLARNNDSKEANQEIALKAPLDPHHANRTQLSDITPGVGTFGKTSLSLQSSAAAEDVVTQNIPFDEPHLTFNPLKYIEELREHWASGAGDASYALLTRCFVLVNSTTSRIKIIDTLVNFLRLLVEADPDSLLPAVWLATNSIGPSYVSKELGLGGSAISRALKNVCGLDSQSLKALYNKLGDAGDVAFEAKKRQSYTLRKPKPLTIKGVYLTLDKIASSKGNGSVEIKQRLVERLLQDARGPEESRYIVRTLAQHLRIGAVKTTMLIALSRALVLSRPPGANFETRLTSELAKLKKEALTEIYSKGEEIVKACYARRPNYNDLVPALLKIGVCEELLLQCGLALHVPLRPMLGSITRDLGEMLTKLQGREFSCEFKYDGQRAQIHCDAAGKVSIFSRHLELMTDKYPDLVALVPHIRGEGVASFIFEGEVVAIDRETGELRPFQTLAGRGRKDVKIAELEVDVCLFAFDLMFLNGEELLDRPFRERRGLLRSLFTEVPHHFTWVKSIDVTSADSETVLEFFKNATDIKCEGVMVKVLDNPSHPAPARKTPADEVQKSGLASPATVQQTPSPTSGTKHFHVTTTARSNELNTRDPASGTGSSGMSKSRRKALLATYEPDKRLDSWLKVKKDYDRSSADTLDLIPVGGWHGQGRKSQWWSPMLLAIRHVESGTLQAVCKCISGFTDKFYADNRAHYAPGSAHVHATQPAYIEYAGPMPDVWFEPEEVWEMAFADVTLSPTYTAAIGLVSEHRGLSLRFPRFLRRRDDKTLEEASSDELLAALWRKQDGPVVRRVVDRGGDGDSDGDGVGGMNKALVDEDIPAPEAEAEADAADDHNED